MSENHGQSSYGASFLDLLFRNPQQNPKNIPEKDSPGSRGDFQNEGTCQFHHLKANLSILVGGLNPSEKYESQLGWWNSQYFWENKIDGNQTTNQYWFSKLETSIDRDVPGSLPLITGG